MLRSVTLRAVHELAASLLSWIAANSPYAVQHLPPPPIRLLEPAAMARLAQGATDTEAAPLHGANGQVWGTYRWDEGAAGTIYLVRPEDTPGAERHATPSDNPVFRERLLHELVHFAQQQTGAIERLNCRAEGERDAYRLGARWLQQQGAPDPLPHRKLMMFIQSSC